MLPATLPEDPDDWVTGDTIYVKCLKAQPTQMASAMTDMAVLAGASAQGAAETVFAAMGAIVKAVVIPHPAFFLFGDIAPAIQTKSESNLAKLGYILRDYDYLAEEGNKPPEQRKADALQKINEWRNCTKVFCYVGHGGEDCAAFVLDKDAWINQHDDTVVIIPLEINRPDSSIVDFVYLNCCDQWNFKPDWQERFRQADAFFGWDDRVEVSVARAFDHAFWEHIGDESIPWQERSLQKAFLKGYEAAEKHDIAWWLSGRPHIDGGGVNLILPCFRE